MTPSNAVGGLIFCNQGRTITGNRSVIDLHYFVKIQFCGTLVMRNTIIFVSLYLIILNGCLLPHVESKRESQDKQDYLTHLLNVVASPEKIESIEIRCRQNDSSHFIVQNSSIRTICTILEKNNGKTSKILATPPLVSNVISFHIRDSEETVDVIHYGKKDFGFRDYCFDLSPEEKQVLVNTLRLTVFVQGVSSDPKPLEQGEP